MFKKLQYLVSVLLALVLALSSIGSASAKPNDLPANDPHIKTCYFGPLNPIGTVPYSVKFVGNEPNATAGYSWMTADTSGVSSVGSGQNFTHVFNNPGTYMVRVTCYKLDGSFAFASTYVTVQAAVTSQPVVTQTPPAPPIGDIPTMDSENVAKSSISGNENIAPVINGDDNIVKITIEQSPTSTPVPLQAVPSNCNDSTGKGSTVICASGNVNINPVAQATPVLPAQPVIKTVATSGFWTFIRMLYAPLIILDQWIVQNK